VQENTGVEVKEAELGGGRVVEKAVFEGLENVLV